MASRFCHASRGFTLVELAIVVTIVALLIGGVLKGQEMLENSRIAATVTQLKSIDAAAATFKQTYRDVPGDIQNPSGRLSNCSASPCSTGGNGNMQVDYDGMMGTTVTSESNTFWFHLNAAGLFATPAPDSGNRIRVLTSMNNSAYFSPAFYDYTPSVGPYAFSRTPARHWMYFSNVLYPPTWYSTPVNKLMKLDLKADDGMPFTGNYLINGGGCGLAADVSTKYDPNSTTNCGFMIAMEF